LPGLSDADLKEIGVTSLGHRKVLLRGIAELSEFSSGIHNDLPSCATPTAERRQLTVMFVDIVGSTALSLRLDPEDMQKVLHQYRGAVASAIQHSKVMLLSSSGMACSLILVGHLLMKMKLSARSEPHSQFRMPSPI
jgi:class 3 adenylate cyclase